MAFGSTLDIVIGGSTWTLTRIRDEGYSSEYLARDSTAEIRCVFRHSVVTSKKADPLLRQLERHNCEVVYTRFPTATDAGVTRKTYTVYENYAGDDLTAVKDFVVGVHAKVDAAPIVTDMLLWMS